MESQWLFSLKPSQYLLFRCASVQLHHSLVKTSLPHCRHFLSVSRQSMRQLDTSGCWLFVAILESFPRDWKGLFAVNDSLYGISSGANEQPNGQREYDAVVSSFECNSGIVCESIVSMSSSLLIGPVIVVLLSKVKAASIICGTDTYRSPLNTCPWAPTPVDTF